MAALRLRVSQVASRGWMAPLKLPPASPPSVSHGLPRHGGSKRADVLLAMLGSLGAGAGSRLVRSLRESGASCDVVLMMPDTPASTVTAAVLAEWRVSPLLYSTSTAPFTELRGGKEKLLRYKLALDYLRAHRAAHRDGRVLLADARDTIFQRDPFSIEAGGSDELFVFMEDHLRTFGNSGINRGHVIPCFGEEAVARVLLSPARPVSCSGVTLGSYRAVLRYLETMWAEVSTVTSTAGPAMRARRPHASRQQPNSSGRERAWSATQDRCGSQKLYRSFARSDPLVTSRPRRRCAARATPPARACSTTRPSTTGSCGRGG